MKKFAFINPNSTQSMTNICVCNLRRFVGQDVVIKAITNHGGPAAIQGKADGEAAIEGVLKAIDTNPTCDGFIIGCFDDTGLFEARSVTPKPVIGIGQASFQLAALRYARFQILTTLAPSIPVIQENVSRQGYKNKCMAVIASGVPVLELENNPHEAMRILSKFISDIEAKDKNQAVILGCAGMTNIHFQLQSKHTVELIDPIMAVGQLIRKDDQIQ